MLNETEKDVAPSDSRLRPDMRLMEEGELEQADKIMHALEVKHSSEKKKEPIWFEMKLNSISNEAFYHLMKTIGNVKKEKIGVKHHRLYLNIDFSSKLKIHLSSYYYLKWVFLNKIY